MSWVHVVRACRGGHSVCRVDMSWVHALHRGDRHRCVLVHISLVAD